MSKPDPQQPNLPLDFKNQRSIIKQLYRVTLQTACTTEALERSWLALARDDIAVDCPRSNQSFFYG